MRGRHAGRPSPSDCGALVLVLSTDSEVLGPAGHAVNGPAHQPLEGPRVHVIVAAHLELAPAIERASCHCAEGGSRPTCSLPDTNPHICTQT